MDIIKHYENIGLSNSDLSELVQGKANIVIYSQIFDYKTIDELLYPYDCCFLLYETRPKWGHWCVIFKRTPNNIEFFDPYGTFIDDQLDFINKNFRKISKQSYPYLTYLLYNSPYKIEYNQYKFQKKGNNIKTCGRWCVCRLWYKYLSLEKFRKLFKNSYGDEIVTYLTAWVNE